MNNKITNFKAAVILILMVIVGYSFTASAYTNSSSYVQKGSISKEVFDIRQPTLYFVYENYIYYASINDWKIYSVDLNSGKRKNIYNSEICEEGILFCSGNLYFKNKSDGALYKIDKNGNNLVKVYNGQIGRGYEGFLSVNNKVICYDKNNLPHQLGCEAIDSSKAGIYEKINLSSRYNNGFIYYYDEEGLKSCSCENGDVKKLTDDSVYSIVYIDDKFIYYINSSNYNLYRISFDGKEKNKLINDKLVLEGPDFNYGNVQFTDNKIYYIDYNVPENPVLCCMSTTDNRKKILRNNAADFRIYKENLYYISSDKNAQLHNMNLKNMVDKIIDSRGIAYLCDIQQGCIIYSAKSEDYNSTFGDLYVSQLGKKFELR